jgi:hypothetical protein
MDERPFVLAVIDACMLLALLSDTSDTSAAENRLAGQLTGLRHDDQVELRAQLAEIASGSDDRSYAAFVDAIADRIGLDRPHPDAHLSWR